jgi:hypothetical protein
MTEQRRLAAIVSADVAGYSRLMGRDESGTLAALKALRQEGSSERRDAITAPAEPPPTTTKSNVPDILPPPFLFLNRRFPDDSLEWCGR